MSHIWPESSRRKCFIVLNEKNRDAFARCEWVPGFLKASSTVRELPFHCKVIESLNSLGRGVYCPIFIVGVV